MECKNDYETKQKEGCHGKGMFELAWEIEELSGLNELGRQIIVDCDSLRDKLLQSYDERIASNFPSTLEKFRQNLSSFVKRVTRYKRTSATHVLVVLICPEERRSKPYALTIQCIAYKSITDSKIRNICSNVVEEMHKRKMKVAGKCIAIIFCCC